MNYHDFLNAALDGLEIGEEFGHQRADSRDLKELRPFRTLLLLLAVQELGN